MLNCIAVDDENLSLDLLKDNIGRISFLCLKGTFTDPFEALDFMIKENIDLLFIDIQMPEITGIEFIKSLTYKPLVIFITANVRYAVDGFDLDIVDFLVKPVPFQRFFKAATKALEWKNLKASSATPQKKEDIFVHADHSLIKISLNNILFIEGHKEYVKFHLNNNPSPVVTRISMKSLDELLPSPDFIRVHKSYVVARAQIHSVKKNTLKIDKFEIPIGEHYKESLINLINPAY